MGRFVLVPWPGRIVVIAERVSCFFGLFQLAWVGYGRYSLLFHGGGNWSVAIVRFGAVGPIVYGGDVATVSSLDHCFLLVVRFSRGLWFHRLGYFFKNQDVACVPMSLPKL